MGLDTVELVLTVEKTFDIEIPNKNAERITTVGELHQFVVEELIRLKRQGVNSDAVFDQIRNIVCIQLGVKPEKVIPSARFVQDLNAD